ncbi:Aerobic respiration control sensor protein ArcB [Pseudoruegeria aquimaris]|uniref:histidine kinase n=1 Tax=Pseudoruegeria aquimaris TaxID=393663 RepID=A0A1Y5S0C4_9RHOB|nr:ATP-binding protein [Pseudoruegeria aquimaris]SLN29100.1 Aerobic respiration control sensor protein ArcB [Pseudoruegeria aquimaris]
MAAEQTDSGRAAEQLALFERRNSEEGRLRRYARRRVEQFLSRQIPTAIGGIALAWLVSPAVGALAVCLALFGEAVDCLFLLQLGRLRTNGWPFERIRFWSAVTGAFQASTLAACGALAWFGAPGGETRFFTVAFMVGALLNAGLVLPHCPLASRARMAIIFGAVCSFFLFDWIETGVINPRLLFDTLAAALLFYVSGVFLSYVVRSYFARTEDKRRMLEGRRRLEEAATAIEAHSRQALRLAHVAKRANDSVIISDPEGRIEWVNETFTRLTGYSREEAIGKRPGDLLNAPETSPETIKRIQLAVARNAPIRTEIRNRCKDGRLIWVETSISPILDNRGNVLMRVAIERDITEAKAREAELARARRDAERANRAKSDFLAMMSHELRTPMNGIIGTTELLLDTELTEDQALLVRTIENSGAALLGILSDILDFTALETDRLVIRPEPYDLAACVLETCTLMQPNAREKGLVLACDVPDGPLETCGDAGRVRQILLNLLTNAIKFTEAGCIAVSLTRRGDASCRITVKDTGKGMDPEVLERLFQPFQTADSPQRREQGGVGLGLAICRTLAKRMGGDLSAESTPGAGATFHLDLPLTGGEATASEGAATRPKAPGRPLPSGLRVLVAEDNRTNRLLLRKMLEAGGLSPEFAENGQEAIEKWRADKPDIILMDLAMPVCTGLEATAAIRAEEQRRQSTPTPIVAVTANASDADRAACDAAGMNGFLAKPIRREALFAEIARHVPQPGTGETCARA